MTGRCKPSSCKEISSSQLGDLSRLFEILSGKKSGDLIKSNSGKLQLSLLRLCLVFDYQ
jgi:hypothetical protein